MDLSELADQSYNFGSPFFVFQHPPDLGVQNNPREAHRWLIPGAVFKLKVHVTRVPLDSYDSWVRVPISRSAAWDRPHRCGFELIRASGEGEQYL
jgi:hypothetical protein